VTSSFRNRKPFENRLVTVRATYVRATVLVTFSTEFRAGASRSVFVVSPNALQSRACGADGRLPECSDESLSAYGRILTELRDGPIFSLIFGARTGILRGFRCNFEVYWNIAARGIPLERARHLVFGTVNRLKIGW
jgi:hypothetical protein